MLQKNTVLIFITIEPEAKVGSRKNNNKSKSSKKSKDEISDHLCTTKDLNLYSMAIDLNLESILKQWTRMVIAKQQSCLVNRHSCGPWWMSPVNVACG